MHKRTKQSITILGVIALILDILYVSFGVVHHYAATGEDVNENTQKIAATYELAQENHHDLIIIKHKLKIDG
jgi:hypothetical protein